MRKLFFNKNIDFIGFAITPLQIKNIIAFAEAFKITGTVIVTPHIKTGYPKNINELKNHKIKVIKIDEPYEEFKNKGSYFSVDTKGKELLFLTAFFKDD